jgi:lipoprotein NlpD
MVASMTKQLITPGDAVFSRQFTPAYRLLLTVFCFAVVVGCASTQRSAPVVDRVLIDSQTALDSTESIVGEQEQVYIVQRGDTLYSIALDHGINLRELAEWNDISNPAAIKLGQQISLSVPSRQTHTMPIALPHKDFSAEETFATAPHLAGEVEEKSARIITEPKGLVLPYSDQAIVQLQGLAHPALMAPPPSLESHTVAVAMSQTTRIENAPEPPNTGSSATLNSSNIDWIWPTDGKVLEGFSDKSKGVRITGVAGQPVLASAAGQVVYSGSGLRGYGKLLIIKHNNTYLSAYAHNSKILVQEGEAVTRGQKIAEMGNSDTDSVKLHFEIRKNGKPVDPLKFLPRGGAG